NATTSCQPPQLTVRNNVSVLHDRSSPEANSSSLRDSNSIRNACPSGQDNPSVIDFTSSNPDQLAGTDHEGKKRTKKVLYDSLCSTVFALEAMMVEAERKLFESRSGRSPSNAATSISSSMTITLKREFVEDPIPQDIPKRQKPDPQLC